MIETLRQTCQKLGYRFFEEGDYNLNLIAVRNDNVFDNKFSDVLYCAYKQDGAWKLLTLPWTTLAGTLGHGGEQSPLTGAETGTGVSGVAVIAPNQYRRAYKFVDNYWQWLSYPYLHQIANMQYWRDNNKDYLVTKDKVYTGNYGTNLHRMSNNGETSLFVNSKYVSWSQGCNGAIEPEFRKLLPILREAVKRYGDVFTYTLLDKAQLV